MTPGDAAVAVGTAALTTAVLLHAGPSVACWPALRGAVAPRLAGRGDPRGVALSFDDGPDPASTPLFLDLLAEAEVRATFFLLGRMVEKAPDLAKRIVAEGHEIALHGYDHRLALLRGPMDTMRDLAHGTEVITEATGVRPRWYRPPYGVLTTWNLRAAARLRLRPVLWTAWGRDWRARATPQSVFATVTRALRPGGTILLHDSDCTSAPGSWRNTIGALPRILEHCERREWRVGPLCEHLGPRVGSLRDS
jgi:peptidoglycan/xylan/chitin deacetylase (PgdA/CDA1 family)